MGFDGQAMTPDVLSIRIPLPIRDNFRVLMKAILSGEIICSTLCLDKLPWGHPWRDRAGAPGAAFRGIE